MSQLIIYNDHITVRIDLDAAAHWHEPCWHTYNEYAGWLASLQVEYTESCWLHMYSDLAGHGGQGLISHFNLMMRPPLLLLGFGFSVVI